MSDVRWLSAVRPDPSTKYQIPNTKYQPPDEASRIGKRVRERSVQRASALALRHDRFAVRLLKDERYDEGVAIGPNAQRVVACDVRKRAEFRP